MRDELLEAVLAGTLMCLLIVLLSAIMYVLVEDPPQQHPAANEHPVHNNLGERNER